jgi:hypothetical protein
MMRVTVATGCAALHQVGVATDRAEQQTAAELTVLGLRGFCSKGQERTKHDPPVQDAAWQRDSLRILLHDFAVLARSS